MLVDPITAPFFANTDMEKQRKAQASFITLVTGGPNHYHGADMKAAHIKFKIGKKEFDDTWKNLQKALHFFKVAEAEINELKLIFYSVESDVETVKPINQQAFKEFSKKVLISPNVETFKNLMHNLGGKTEHKEKKSLCDRLGGEAAITAVVSKFYDYMLVDPITAPFFANTDMEKQRKAQASFITLVTGGPNHYHGADMKAAHAKFSIGQIQFNETWKNLEKALNDFKVPQAEKIELRDVFYSVQADVVNKH